ncbi:hypothetical protein Poly24_03850 [Rosistilla carotiformis]|uniref:Uncharacterized protein n=1 Tax=Rosistilla carotiformis TaxID=2528017 RepID=A0A518JMD7_9BACT|nr:PepSY domain-containing protein [Rosistilla carotiformis]QDV66698.1 hypothetical protein Poly24_03850 [Rosistilla carotiformis]
MSSSTESATPSSPDDLDNANGESARRVPKKKTRAEKLGRSTVMLLRRIHLYSGIFMFPWVLMYGFSGWMFNHPRMFTADEVTTYRAADLDDGLLTDLTSAQQTAIAVVEQINLQTSESQGPELRITDDRRPLFSGHLEYNVNTPTAKHQLAVNPVTGDGEVRTTLVDPEADDAADNKPDPLAEVYRVEIEPNVSADIQRQIPEVLDQLGLPSNRASLGYRKLSVVFSAEADGIPCIVSYNLADGSVNSVREDDRPQLTKKAFLQRMHLGRIYTPVMEIRWLWALLVDAMFVSMVFWGCSGLLMWWQIKRTRWLGMGLLATSILFATFVGLGMHDQMTSTGPPKKIPANLPTDTKTPGNSK